MSKVERPVRPALGYSTAVLLLLATGIGLWTTGRVEQRLVNARTQLLTLQYDAPLSEYDDIERSVSRAPRVPWIAKVLDQLREQRATSRYWRRDYGALVIERDASGMGVESDPAIRLLAANAAFRRTRLDGSDRSAAERLNEILDRYAELLRREPQQFDVAYNYELVARTRDKLLARTSKSGAGREGTVTTAPPSSPTIHGRPGAPAAETDLSEFKIMVPQRRDERQQQPEAGLGGRKPRKG